MKINWNTETKEELSYFSAFLALIFSLVITTYGFLVEPHGEIHDSVLWLLGQCLFYSGAVFGISGYIKSEIRSLKDKSDLRQLDNYK